MKELSQKYEAKLEEKQRELNEFIEKYNDINLEIFTTSIKDDIGGPEEMFAKDFSSKHEILQPAFDRVMIIGDAGVDLIARHAELVTRFNRDEVNIEDIGAEMEKLK